MSSLPSVRKPQLHMLNNFSQDLPSNWSRMVPPDYPFEVVNFSGGRGLDRITVVANGTYLFGPEQLSDKLLLLTMEPRDYRSLVPPLWRNQSSLMGHNAIEWHLSRSFQELVEERHLERDLKLKRSNPVLLSAVSSGLTLIPGHRLRVEFLRALDAEPEFPDWHLFGFSNPFKLRHYQRSLPDKAKDGGLVPYRYSVCIENCRQNDYWSEKVVDAVLALTVPVYFGCPNIQQYLDPRCMILLDIRDPKRAIARLRSELTAAGYERRLPFLRRERERLLRLSSLFPSVERMLCQRQLPPQVSVFVDLAADDLEGWERWCESCLAVGLHKYERFEFPTTPGKEKDRGQGKEDNKKETTLLHQDQVIVAQWKRAHESPRRMGLLCPQDVKRFPPVWIKIASAEVLDPSRWLELVALVLKVQKSPEPEAIQASGRKSYVLNWAWVKESDSQHGPRGRKRTCHAVSFTRLV